MIHWQKARPKMCGCETPEVVRIRYRAHGLEAASASTEDKTRVQLISIDSNNTGFHASKDFSNVHLQN